MYAGSRVDHDAWGTIFGVPRHLHLGTSSDKAATLISWQSPAPGMPMKVLFITGFSENAAVANGHPEPRMELLTKPFTLEAISVKVVEMLKAPAS